MPCIGVPPFPANSPADAPETAKGQLGGGQLLRAQIR